MAKNLEHDFEEFKQALTNVESVYKYLMDCVELNGELCKEALYDVKRAPLSINTVDKIYNYMNELDIQYAKLKELFNIMDAEVHNALVYYDSLESEYY